MVHDARVKNPIEVRGITHKYSDKEGGHYICCISKISLLGEKHKQNTDVCHKLNMLSKKRQQLEQEVDESKRMLQQWEWELRFLKEPNEPDDYDEEWVTSVTSARVDKLECLYQRLSSWTRRSNNSS